jgi:microsomal dipeptidase-like Zn-dependent dipeptidase
MGAAAIGSRIAGRHLVARTERRMNRVRSSPPYVVSDRVAELHGSLDVVDLHADSLLWGRDLLIRGDRGHVDVPRLIEGRVALQAFAACPKVPRHINLDRNEDRSDEVLLLGLASGWPVSALTSLVARTLLFASRLERFAARSAGRLTIVRTAADLGAHLERRSADPTRTAGLLTIEGSTALEGDVANLERFDDAGFRMLGLAHFTDNPFAGSAHGVAKGGLTARGRELVVEMERRSILVDVAHASPTSVDDVLSIARRPVVASHTGVRGIADNIRNLTDEQLRGIAATGGLVGIGFWPTACGGEDAGSIARSIAYAVDVAGVQHVALGSDFDGAVPVPFDVSGIALLTEALLDARLTAEAVRMVMGGNALRLLARTLPGPDSAI